MHDFNNLGPIIYNSYTIFSDIPRFFYRISLSIVPIGKKFATFALVSTYGTTMVLHKEGVYRMVR